MSNLTFGIDISRYQYSQDGKIQMNFDQAAANREPAPIVFCAIRSGISWGYTDPWFTRSWQESLRVGWCRLAYHVLYFGESPLRQADKMFNIVGKADWDHDRLVLDLEVQHTNSPAKITETTLKVMEICKSRTGIFPMNYSRASWVNQHMLAHWLPPETEWWLAQYRWALPAPLYTPEYPPPPTLPTGVKKWLVHQTGEKGKSIGTTSMRYMDYNRWNDNNKNIFEYFNMTHPEPPVTPPYPPKDLDWLIDIHTNPEKHP